MAKRDQIFARDPMFCFFSLFLKYSEQTKTSYLIRKKKKILWSYLVIWSLPKRYIKVIRQKKT